MQYYKSSISRKINRVPKIPTPSPSYSSEIISANSSPICKKCGINVANPTKAWCQLCYINNKKKSNIEQFSEEAGKIKNNINAGNYNKSDKNPSALRHEVWKKYVSEIYRKGKCFCCRSSDIEESNFECGHVISRKNDGSFSLENLRPICSQCNKSMGAQNMDEFIVSCGFWKNSESEKLSDCNNTIAKSHVYRSEEDYIKEINSLKLKIFETEKKLEKYTEIIENADIKLAISDKYIAERLKMCPFRYENVEVTDNLSLNLVTAITMNYLTKSFVERNISKFNIKLGFHGLIDFIYNLIIKRCEDGVKHECYYVDGLEYSFFVLKEKYPNAVWKGNIGKASINKILKSLKKETKIQYTRFQYEQIGCGNENDNLAGECIQIYEGIMNIKNQRHELSDNIVDNLKELKEKIHIF